MAGRSFSNSVFMIFLIAVRAVPLGDPVRCHFSGSDGSGAVTKLEFQWAMEQVGAGAGSTFTGDKAGAKGKKSNKKRRERGSSKRSSGSQKNDMEVLVNALDVDGDGEISFTELVDGLMRRRQEAKLLHGEKLKRAAKEAEKKAKYRAERMKVKGY